MIESGEIYKLIVENVNNLVAVINQDIVFEYMNENVHEKLTGYSSEDLLGKDVLKFIHLEDHKKILHEFENSFETGMHFTELRFKHKEGHFIWIETNGKQFVDKDGKTRVLTISRNITERKLAEKKLRDSEEKYRIISETAYDLIIVLNQKFKYEYINENAFQQILGYSKEDLLGKSALLFAHPDDVPKTTRVLFDGFKKGSGEAEFRLKHKAGHWLWLEGKGKIFSDNDGELKAIIISRDITERKKAEEKLKESEEKYRDLYEEAPNAYFSIGNDQNIIKSNKAAGKLLGYNNEEFSKMRVLELYDDKENGLKKAQDVFKRYLQGESIQDEELQMKKKNGQSIWVSLTVKPIFDQEGNIIESRSMVLDINERKLAQEELESSYKKLREMEYIINNSPSIVFLWQNLEGWPVEFVSKNIIQFGYTPEDFYSGKVIYADIIHPDDITRVAEEVSNYSNEDTTEFIQEYRIKTKSGQFKWIDDRTWIRRDLEGNITHYQGIVSDITDHKNADEALKLSEKKYRKAYNRANFYKDIFGHDINNILHIINSSAELISYHLGDSEKSKVIEDISNIIKKQVERGAKLVSNVNTLSQLEEESIHTKPTEICKLMQNSIDFLTKTYDDKKIIVNDVCEEDHLIANANDLLQDVFDNILINSIKYNENPTIEIVIKVSKTLVDRKKFIKMEFSDNGIGVPDDRKKIIFKRGNRELKGSKGMGIGLSLVKKIMKGYDGKIWVEDKVKGDYSQGSNFIL
ncbi:MAG: PAS domain S-box protein, partial [Candidatus Lokiarchaeota archaeon]|nr:PAS domain S-box protein [Candidatus Lokiarchaeota archaeon]